MLQIRRTLAAACAGLALLTGCAADNAGSSTATREQSVAPGINDSYRDADIDEWIGRLERDQREIYAMRLEIAADVGVGPGDAVADIGAGTGIFTMLFADTVGPDGQVYAVDIVPEFIEHIEKSARDAGRRNIRAVLCEEDSVNLPPNSIDVAFICDTYHHFEYPRASMASLHRALRPGGEVVVIDFKRIEGESSDFILSHVRAGQDVFVREIRGFGYELISEEAPSVELELNYYLRFRKIDAHAGAGS